MMRMAIIEHAPNDFDVQVGYGIASRLTKDEVLAVVASTLYGKGPCWLQHINEATDIAVRFGWRLPVLISAILPPALESSQPAVAEGGAA